MSFSRSFAKASASSREVSKKSLTKANRAKREVAKLALDLCKGAVTTQIGKKYPKLVGDLGEDDFKRYSTDPPILSLQKIYYCQSGLQEIWKKGSQSLASSQKELKERFASTQKELKELSGKEVTIDEAQAIEQMRGFINHDYLVLELQSNSNKKLYILAEKTAVDVVGISVQEAQAGHYDQQQVVLHKIDCGGVAMKLDSLQKLLLEADTPNYNLRDNNCWDYTLRATQRVLDECISMVSGGDEAKKAQLAKARRDLEANLMVLDIGNSWMKAANWLAILAKKTTDAW